MSKRKRYHGGFPLGSVPYECKSFKRRGAFIRYISAENVIWILGPDLKAYYKQCKEAMKDATT